MPEDQKKDRTENNPVPQSSGEHASLDEVMREADQRWWNVLPDTVDIAMQERVRAVVAEQRRADDAVQSLVQGAQLEFHEALEIHTRFVTDASMAEQLARRHNQQIISRTFVKEMLEFPRTKNPKPLEDLRSYVEKHGFFLFQYTEKQMRDRITSHYTVADHTSHPAFIITEASGRHPDPRHQNLHENRFWAADCQIHLPQPEPSAECVLELPCASDHVIRHDFVEKVQQHPYSVALVADIVCAPELSGLRLAANAMDRGLRAIREQINPARPGVELRWVAAAIGILRGMYVVTDQHTSMLEQGVFRNIAPIGNSRSFFLFGKFGSTQCSSFRPVYTLLGRRHSMQFESIQHGMVDFELIVDWHVLASDLKAPPPSAQTKHTTNS